MKQTLITLLFLCYLGSVIVLAQNDSVLPKLYPAYSEDFIDNPTYSPICFSEAFQDQNGKLWLYPCGPERIASKVHFIQFDGYEFKLVQGDWEDLKESTKFVNLYQKREFVGIVGYKSDFQFFHFNLLTDELELYEINQEGIIEMLTVTANDQIHVVIRKEEKWFFYEWTDKRLIEEGSFDIPAPFLRDKDLHQKYVLLLNEEEFWIAHWEMDYMLRINKKNGIATKVHLSEFPIASVPSRHAPFGRAHKGKFMPQNATYIYVQDNTQRLLYKLNPQTDKFERVKGIPENWAINFIDVDHSGNTIFLFTDQAGDYQAILQNATGQRFDYSAFFKPFNGRGILDVIGPNFMKKLSICHGRGIFIQRVKTAEAIQHILPDYGIRAMIQVDSHNIFITAQSHVPFLLDPLSGKLSQPEPPSCAFNGKKAITGYRRDNLGNFWIPRDNTLIRYIPNSNECEEFPLDLDKFLLLTLKAPGQVFVLGNMQQLYLFDTATQELQPVMIDGVQVQFEAKVLDLYYDPEEVLWVAASDGLWKINLATEEIRLLGHGEDFKDYRFSCIEADKKGHLWLGTAFGGLQIYDPKTEEVKVVDVEQGLANSTIVSITEDNDGDRWLATYNGISIVDPNGDLIANLNLQDGLTERENNRYSNLKTLDGKILIGTIKGLHIIDPVEVKRRFSHLEKISIYPTSLTYYDRVQRKKITQQYGLSQIETLVLPASQRSLELSFALSNYFEPNKNQYAYQLNGLEDDWHFLDNQHKINLTTLPAGKYELLVKGVDGYGNWTEEPLSISIYAQEYFYKKTWFLLLVLFSALILVGAIAWLWISRLRTEVQKATLKIRQDKEVIEHQAEQLKDLDKAKSIFFTNISHEFRTPLTVISGLARRLFKYPDDRTPHSFQMIERNSDNLLNLVNQILDLRKLESGKLEITWIQADIIPYLRYIFESFELLAHNKNIEIRLDMKEEELVMDYDKKKILRIVSNLLSNAIKFTPEGGNIYVMVNTFPTLGVLETPRVGKVLKLIIKDTGIGIPPEKRPHIFDRFYQADGTATREGEGTGIGLALCKELVNLLGGAIEVDTEEGVGSTFSVTLPITNNASTSEAELEDFLLPSEAGLSILERPVLQPKEEATGDNDLPLIMLVEDNSDVMQYLITCLESNHNLIIARDGQEGIEKGIESIPDAIISDVMMPHKDGFELCYTLKTDERTSHIPIILLTAKADVDSRLSGLRRGADDYLTKPFNEEELLTRLSNQMEIRRRLQHYFQHAAELVPEEITEEVKLEHEFLGKIKSLLEQHLDDENYGIAEICRGIGASRTQLHRKIKALTGESTSIYIRRFRLHKAKELLETTDMNVSEVLFEVGFSSLSYFSRVFSNEFGISPSEVVKR